MPDAPIAAGPLDIPVMPCPFCGRAPKSTGRPATESEKWKDERFVHFIACYCGGYSATAHKMGSGRTAHCAERDAAAKWNTRHNALVQANGAKKINEGDGECSVSPATEG